MNSESAKRTREKLRVVRENTVEMVNALSQQNHTLLFLLGEKQREADELRAQRDDLESQMLALRAGYED
jgi:hypothetical protein